MRYLIYSPMELNSYPVCILVTQIDKEPIRKAYIEPFDLDENDVLVLDLHQAEGKKKTPAKEMKAYIESELLPVLKDTGTEYLVVTDSEYFKVLTKVAKTEVNLGYVLPCVFEESIKVVYAPNYRSIFYDPEAVRDKIARGITALIEHRQGNYTDPGDSIIAFADYPIRPAEIESWLERLIVEDRPLTCDIETLSLKHPTAGIGTISFAWSKHEGIAFPVDLGPDPARVRKALLSFFRRFRQKVIYHGISFDAYVLIYQLFMKHILDREGLLDGLETMLSQWECTKLITYLATNSCAGNNLKLKHNAQEFAGNYAVDEINDITKIPLDELLQYNLVDALSTWYVYEKNYPVMVADQQLDIYQNLFQPGMVDIIDMQLTGMPVNMNRVLEVEQLLAADEQDALSRIQASPLVQRYTYRLNEHWVAWKNSTLKKKRVTLADANEVFNPNSGPQLQDLLFSMLQLPVLGTTDNGEAATGGKILEDLKNHTNDPLIVDLLTALADYKAVNKITTSFIPALKGAFKGPDGWYYLFGNFNLGGTVSGRLSSSGPNLQNLPANSKYAKLIKSCFEAPPGWLFVGLDFNSLEDRISALTTKDPNKLKVYTDGYDGHSLRAYAYFGEHMPDIDPNSVVSINSIAKHPVYKTFRQDSKVPTFLLTYQGTHIGMMAQTGFSKEKAMLIEERYHELYRVSDEWVAAKLEQACKDGYVTAAFGLRVRTPLLKQVIRGNSKTPYQAEAEGRTAGNALGQSWCLLNTRAGVEFNSKARRSEYRLMIKPSAHIHDAQYFIIRDDIRAIQYTNDNLVKAVEWQEAPEIAHDEVKLGGELSIFYPTWNDEIGIPNGATEEQIFSTIDEALAKRAA